VERGDGDGQAPNQGEDAHLLLCGQCSVTTKGKECGKGHGAAEMEYKCRYCCDVRGLVHFPNPDTLFTAPL